MSHHDYAAANKAHFDKLAAQGYDEVPHALELARRTATAMRNAYNFDEDTTEVMDFACGTGLISRQLAPYVKSIVGVDISAVMVERYNQRVLNQGITPEEMQAVCVDLHRGDSELKGARFDVIVCGSSYHHFTSIKETTRVLADFLKPDGVLLVVDLLRADSEGVEAAELFPEHAADIVAYPFGFLEADIMEAFAGAGLEALTFKAAMAVKKRGRDVKLFIASGKKSGGST